MKIGGIPLLLLDRTARGWCRCYKDKPIRVQQVGMGIVHFVIESEGIEGLEGEVDHASVR